MPRKQVGELDEALIERMDARAAELGQTREVFLAQAVESHINFTGTELRRAPGLRATSAQAKAHVKPIERPSTTTQARKGARLKK